MDINLNNLGKGIYIWNIRDAEDGSIDEIVGKSKVANFRHVLIKIANGTVGWNWIDGIDKAKELATKLKAEGIQPWGWHYVYGNDPIGEADTAKRRVEETGVVGYMIDAEGDYKNKFTNADKFVNRLDLNVPIGLGTYRYPSLHPELPWKEFMPVVEIMMPQIYWIKAHNPAEQVRETLSDYEGYLNWTGPFALTGAAFDEGKWTPTIEDIEEFIAEAKAQGIKSINFWEWSEMKEPREFGSSFWKSVIKDFEWDTQEPEPIPDPLEIRITDLEEDMMRLGNQLFAIVEDLEDYQSQLSEINGGLKGLSKGKANKTSITSLQNELQDQKEDLVTRIVGARQRADEALDKANQIEEVYKNHKHKDVGEIDCGFWKRLLGKC